MGEAIEWKGGTAEGRGGGGVEVGGRREDGGEAKRGPTLRGRKRMGMVGKERRGKGWTDRRVGGRRGWEGWGVRTEEEGKLR